MDQQTNAIPNKPAEKKRPAFQGLTLQRERVAGWIYLPIHVIVLPILLSLIFHIESENADPATMVSMNLWYYAVGIVFLGVFLFRYYRDSFSAFTENFKQVEITLLIGIAVLMAGNIIINLIFSVLGKLPESPNQTAVEELTKSAKTYMFVIAILFAPIVEEALFRGVIFGTIRSKSRVAAYIVSVIAFSLYHVWQYAIAAESAEVLLSAVAYVPISITLAFCYDRSGTIWTSTLFHAVYNAAALLVTTSAK